MLSRVADGLFWISRYVERAEVLARLADVYLQTELERVSGRKVDWVAVLLASGAGEDFEKAGLKVSAHGVTQFLTAGEKNPNSIAACWERARENSRMIRDQLTTEMWEELNRAWLELCGAKGKGLLRSSLPEYYREVRRFSHLFRGTTSTTLSWGDGRDFLGMGMYLERADATSRILEAKSLQKGEETLEHGWAALLRSCSAGENYRALHQGPLEGVGVLRYLITDPLFPRSLHHCLKMTGAIASRLAKPEKEKEVRGLVESLIENLKLAPIEEMPREGLAEFLDGWQGKLHLLADWLREHLIGAKLELPEKEAWRSQQEQQQQNDRRISWN